MRYLRAEGVERDYEQAVAWLSKAAEGGHALAQFSLALRYKLGQGVNKDPEKEVYWYQKSASQGNLEAQYYLALLLLKGEGVEQDIEKALFMLSDLAVEGHESAQYQLYTLYNKGNIVGKDETLSRVYLLKASESGHSDAQYHLGQIYHEQGLLREALYWLHLSADQNYAPAQKMLDGLQTAGKKNLQDIVQVKVVGPSVKVIADRAKAAELTVSNIPFLTTDSMAEKEKDVVTESIDQLVSFIPTKAQIKQSLVSNSKSMDDVVELVTNVKEGDPVAQHNLSTLFSDGIVVPKDNRKAFMLMLEAAKQGLTQSQNSVAIMYLDGVGVDSDREQAYFWASTSARKGNHTGKKILLQIISKNQ